MYTSGSSSSRQSESSDFVKTGEGRKIIHYLPLVKFPLHKGKVDVLNTGKMISYTVMNIFLSIATVSAEFYTSLIMLKTVIGAEKDIPIMTNSYMKKELERLDYLKKFAREIQERNDKVIRDGEKTTRNPINALLLIKRMTADWNKLVKIMQSNSADDVIRNVTCQKDIKHTYYPTQEDLSGAVIGLLRLQDTYQMGTRDIADGRILSSQMRRITLTAGDCFEIGLAAYRKYDYYHTILWMQEARERTKTEAVPTANLEDILDYLAFSLYKQGNLKRALLLTDELYHINPDHPRAKDNVKNYEDLLEDDGVERIDMRRNIPRINNVRIENEFDEGVKLTYEALCRQEVLVDTKAQSQFYCYYKMDRPYLRLAPFKVEIVRQNPLIALFHDIMSDEEAGIIQMLGFNGQAKINLFFSWRNFLFHNEFIVSASLKSTEHEIVKRIDRRLEFATNLEMGTAEDLQSI
ncbi:unnamed protein product [Onchocerca flexuosa]|uniref:P4Ha_N domain-containing protein n=1 Tax=Onchocerca flexuosa TaxID=387005 RepID=A0A183I2Y0_9BILA|nr:unnamed protein product [Onchocerca flexuosa]